MVMMLYPPGCLNPITLHIYPIMFTGRSNAYAVIFRVADYGRAGRATFPLISPVPCEGYTALLLACCECVIYYQTSITDIHIAVKANASQTVRLIG